MKTVGSRILRPLRSLGAVFFAEDLLLGSVLVLSCFLSPRMGICAVMAGAGAWGVSRVLHPRAFTRLPELLNSGLWGLFIGSVLPFGFRTGLLAPCGGALLSGGCLVLSARLKDKRASGLVLSFPFAVSVGFTAWILPEELPQFARSAGEFSIGSLLSFFTSLSVVTFQVSMPLGILFFLLILRRSLWLAGLSVTGYLLGWALEGLLLQNGFTAPPLFSGLNYILIAMALGGGLLPPDRNAFLRVLGGVGGVVLLQLGLERGLGEYTWLSVTLSFNLIALMFFHGKETASYHPDWLNFSLSPEGRMDLRRYRKQRYSEPSVHLHLPVLGKWCVYQGENGAWTHQFDWRHAVDLVLTDDTGKRFVASGKELPDYYAWNKTIVSPIDGVVETVVAGLPDQKIGQVETEHNWGNMVILRDPEGFRVLIAHMKFQSALVMEGQSVRKGQWLGRCGNSGYSPEPHVHIHVQQEAYAGAPTLPFRFRSFAVGSFLPKPCLPDTGVVVEGRTSDEFLSSATSYLLDQDLTFVSRSGEQQNLRIRLAEDGSFRMGNETGAVYFGRWQERFIFYSAEGENSFFQQLFSFFPSFPLYAKVGDTWTDVSPYPQPKVALLPPSLKRSLGREALPEVNLSRVSADTILSTLPDGRQAQMVLSEDRGIVRVATPDGNWSLKSYMPQEELEESEAMSEARALAS